MEIELKLKIDAAEINKLRQLPILRQLVTEPPHMEDMATTYFDTPDLWFHRHRAGLRVREIDGTRHWTQTLKVGGNVNAGLHQRQEWQSQIPSTQPGFKALVGAVDDPRWKRKLQSQDLADQIRPVFTLRIKRSIWLLRLGTGDEVELGLDEGSIECDGKQLPVHEIELELKSGEAEHLFDFAVQLLESLSLRIEIRSKSERGYDLLTSKEAPNFVKAGPLTLSDQCTIEGGFQEIIRDCTAHVLANEEGVISARDPESIHQMRVGIRRLRSSLKVFSDLIPIPENLQEELTSLATQLGEARDWDVLADSTLSKVASAVPGDVSIEAIRQAALDRARQKREKAAAAVSSVQYTRLILTLSAWREGARWRQELDSQAIKQLQAPLHRFADKVLEHDQKLLHKRGKHLQQADPLTRHRMRIAAKKTRYATEFFYSLYPKKRVEPYVDALSELQDELGWLNDVAVADRLLREFQGPGIVAPDLAWGAGFARGFLSSAIDIERPKLAKMWKQFLPIKAPCRR